jgi:hypothetical protein
MLEDVKLLTGRRAYEFRPDDLRLSILSIKPIQDAIQELFHFQTSVIGTPIQSFGEVSITFPPGIVFNTGFWQSPDNQFVPIRFLHFEPSRIVIDVAGSSTALTSIFERLWDFLTAIQAPDGSPVLGKPERILDYSEISARFPFPLDAVISQPLRNLFSGIVKESILIPTLVLQSFSTGQKLTGSANPGDTRSFTLAPRSGTLPEDHIYFSAVPLDSEAHLRYLNELEAALTS